MNTKIITYEQIREITLEVTTLHNKLMELGLYQTGHCMHDVVEKIGWELAEIIEGKHFTHLPKTDSEEIFG